MLSNKNIANYTTFNDILVNRLEIQNNGPGLIIYESNPNNPEFSFDPSTAICTMNGSLNVNGSASFETVSVSEFSAGMISLANNNPGNTMDLGLNANYNDGVSKYAGIIKDVDDTFQRWTFFKDITTTPVTTIEVIDYTKLDSVRMNALYVNDGAAATPSITFHNDTNTDTGLYLAAQNEIGISAGAQKIAGIRYINGSTTEFQLDTTTTLKLLKLGTVDDIASNALGVNVGHFYLASLTANDKWMKFYSFTNAVTPSYSGAVFTSPNNNYFLTNTGTNLELVRNTTVTSSSSPPDYRDGTTAQIFIVSGTTFETKNLLYLPLGSLGAPALAFAQETGTGLYRSNTNSLGIVTGGANILNIASTAITATQAYSNINGIVSAPAYAFTSNTGTGVWRDNSSLYENVSLSAGGALLGTFQSKTSISQWITGSAGTAAVPSISWANDNATGLFSPTSEAASGQLSISLSATEIARFRGRSGTGSGNTEFYNSLMITPDGVIQKLSIAAPDTRVANVLKANESWFQAYNLIDATPIILYTFRSSGAVGKDYSNNGYNATTVGSPTATSFVEDTNDVVKRDALDLTSNTTKYLNLATSVSALLTLNNVSISFWFKISGALSTDNTIFACYKLTGTKEISIKVLADGASFPNAMQVTVQSDALTTLQYHTATSSDSGTPSPVAIKDGLWHHVLIELGDGIGSSNPKYLMFLDGVQLSVAANTIYFTSTGDNSGNPSLSTNSFNDLTFNYASIGALYNGTSGSLFYTGYLKDFYITGRLVSTAEIATLATEPYIYTYGLDVAVINASQVNFTGAFSFNDGSAAAPSITFTSNTNLGIYKSASNVLGIATSGVERLTVADSVLKYSSSVSDAFEIDGGATNAWLKLKMSPGGNFGPRLVFQYTGTAAEHSLRSSHHASTITSNFIDLYLFDTSGADSTGLGTNQIARFGQTATGPNTGLLTIYGVEQIYDGTVAAPSYSFTNSTGLGLYRIGSNDMGIAAGGVLKFEVNSVVTVGNGSADATTRLYAPLGSNSLPSYSFIGNTNTGIYSSGANNIDFTCNGANIANLSASGLLSQGPIISDVNSTTALWIRQDGAPTGGDIFIVDTTNSRISYGYTNLYLYKNDSYNNSSNQRMRLEPGDVNAFVAGFMLTNQFYSGTNAKTTALSIGKDTNNANLVNASFFYVGNGNTSNKLQFGYVGISDDQFNIKADGSTNVTGTFSVSSTSAFADQIYGKSGLVSSPSFSFTGDTTTGIYRIGASNIGFTTGSSLSFNISNTAATAAVPIYLSNGLVSAPSLAFTNSTTTGTYFISSNRFGISNGNQNTWIFDNRGTAPHECLNELYAKPDGTNLRLYVQDKKLRASSNQTILNVLPIIHYKFASAPATNTTTQDESINKYVIEATTASYVTSTISLTDTNGVGLLQYQAAQLITQGTDRIETNTDTAEFLFLSNFIISIKFKATAITSGSLFEIYGNKDSSTAANFIIASVVNGDLNLQVHNGTSLIINGSTTSVPFTTNVWYNLVFNFNTTLNTFTNNGTALTLTYSTGNSGVDVVPSSLFTNNGDLTIIVGGVTTSIAAYIAEFYIAPTSTSEVVTALYRTQAHELYTNKLQVATTEQGIVDEGYILRSDKGNNAIWDNSLQIFAGYIQLNSSKVLRLSDGSVTSPAYSFLNNSNLGIYRIGADNVGISTGGQKRIDISNSATLITNDFQLGAGLKHNVTTVSTTSATLDSTYDTVNCSYTTDATTVTITLPVASSNIGREYTIIKTGNGGGSLVVATASGSDFIDDASTTSITLSNQFDRVTLRCVQSTRWFSI